MICSQDVEDSALSSLLVPGALAAIMFILGLSLTPADFRRVFEYPRGIAVGMGNLVVVSPLLAFAIASLYGLPPELAVGLVLLGASPGGTMANLLTHLARAETALSVTMTAVSSLAAVVTVPLYLTLAASHFGLGGVGDIEIVPVALRVFAVTVLPISAGLAIRVRRPEAVLRREALLRQVAVVIFAIVVAGVIAAEHERVFDNLAAVGAAALTLNVTAMAISFTVSKLVRLDDRQATAIALELGVHNAVLAIAVGTSIAAGLSAPAAVYSVFMFVTGIGFAWFMSRRLPGHGAARAGAAQNP